ncbi:unnamed protein product, partial [Urochloa humidicola]
GGRQGSRRSGAGQRRRLGGQLTYEIFSLLKAKFLFFGRNAAARPGLLLPAAASASSAGKVCVLSIDGGAPAHRPPLPFTPAPLCSCLFGTQPRPQSAPQNL